MTTNTTKIAYAMTLENSRYEHFINIGSSIDKIKKHNDLYSTFISSDIKDKKGNPIVLMANTERLLNDIEEAA